MPDLRNLYIDDIELTRFELPEQIFGLGVMQGTAEHQLSGGRRVVQPMGPYPHDRITWSGVLGLSDGFIPGTSTPLAYSNTGADRAMQLQAKVKAGKLVTLTFNPWKFKGYLKAFTPKPGFAGYIPYDIEFIPTEDVSGGKGLGVPLPTQVASLNAAFSTLLSKINTYLTIPGLPSSLAVNFNTVAIAVSKVQSLLAQNGQVISSVIQAAMNTNLSSMSQVVFFLGGYLSSTVPSSNAIGLIAGYSQAVAAAADVLNLTQNSINIANRTIKDLPKFLTITNPNLFALASQYYGDSTLWTIISTANNNLAPFATGTFNVLIPPIPKQ
jgi:hypothetical protein